jgi:hypothetical protein
VINNPTAVAIARAETNNEEWIRKAAITVVTERIAELQCCGDADAPDRLEVLPTAVGPVTEGVCK